MPQILKSSKGDILAIFSDDFPVKLETATQPPDPNALAATGQPLSPGQTMLEADLAFIRVLEDLIQILIDRDLLQLYEFPVRAQEKIMARGAQRSKIQQLRGLINDYVEHHGNEPNS